MRALRLILLIALVLPASGQSFRGALVGRVTSRGKPLAGAKVTIDSDALQSTRSTRTTTRGTWWAGELPPGTYRVTFAHTGTQTVTRKAEVRLAETARLDADLEPSEEGESVTVTTMTRTIFDRPEIVTAVDSALVDDLPAPREVTRRIELGPGVATPAIRRSAENVFIVDGVVQLRRGGDVEIEEAIANEAVISTATSAEFGRFTGGTVVALTRSGGNDFSATIRDTLTSDRWTAGPLPGDGGTRSRLEATTGGRIIRDALWFFLAGEDANAEDRERSMSAKLTASAGTRDSLVATVLRAARPDETRAAASLVHVLDSRALLTGDADTSRIAGDRFHHASIAAEGLLPTASGDHDMKAGLQDFGGSHAVFANDTWSDAVRWTLSGGLRYDDGIGTSPRAGVVYDLHDDHAAHLLATFGRYRTAVASMRESQIAYAQTILTNGFGRLMLVKRTFESGIQYRAIEADARGQYLFVSFGGSITAGDATRSAAAWISGSPPAVEQHITAALLERYRHGAATDLSVQYRIAKYRVQPFVKLDVLNLFDQELAAEPDDDPIARRRAARIAIGARF